MSFWSERTRCAPSGVGNVMRDRLSEMYTLQREQQEALGLDPAGLNDAERRTVATELVAQAHEEVTDLGRHVPGYKRHLLRMPAVVQMDAAEDVADVFKCALAWAQLNGITAEQLMDAFRRKTAITTARAEAERTSLEATTKLLCVDLDDVVVDISEWRALLEAIDGATPAAIQANEEAFKDEWNRSGGFLRCPPVRGAPEALRKVKAHGYTIAVVTARPQWQYRRLQGDTMDWLTRHDVPYDLLLFNKDKCEAVYHHIQPAWPRAFVEDHTRNATALAAIGVPVLLFDTPRNRDMPEQANITRVNDWQAVLAWLGI